MDDVTRNRINSFDNCEQWFSDHAAGVDSNGKLKDTKNQFNAKLTTAHTLEGEVAGAVSESEEQTGVKAASREDGVEIAMKVHVAAKAAEIEHPGIQSRYPYPRNLNDEDFVNLLRSYVIGGNTDQDIIKEYGAPNDWVTQCTNTANAIEAASQAQSAAKQQHVGKRAQLLAIVDELMQLKRTAGYLIDNVFADDIAALISWKSAAHVEKPPKKKTPTP
jgi:hypothetical protein